MKYFTCAVLLAVLAACVTPTIPKETTDLVTFISTDMIEFSPAVQEGADEAAYRYRYTMANSGRTVGVTYVGDLAADGPVLVTRKVTEGEWSYLLCEVPGCTPCTIIAEWRNNNAGWVIDAKVRVAPILEWRRLPSDVGGRPSIEWRSLNDSNSEWWKY